VNRTSPVFSSGLASLQQGCAVGALVLPSLQCRARTLDTIQSTAFAEISAVCTHPGFRGRGYARALVRFLAAQILATGKTPFLHVKSENGAKVVYQKIGFRLRAAIRLTVISLR